MTPAETAKAEATLQGTVWTLLRLVTGHVCLHASMAGMRMAAPLWALKQGYGPLEVGFLLALFSLTQVFLALPAGRFADQHGLRRPVSWAIVASMSGAALAAVFPHFWTLCVAALCMGGATGAAAIALQRHVGRAAHDASELRRVFSWLSIGPAISNFIGPVSVGLLIDHGGYALAFAFTAVVPGLAWLCVRHTVELQPVEQVQGVRNSAWPLLREPLMRKLLLVNWLLSSCWDVHTFVVPLLGHERGFSASVIGTILGAFAIAAASVRVVMPLLASRLKEWVVVAGAMVVTALLFALYPFMASAWAMGLCSVLLGLALGTVQPMIMSTLHQITPHAQHGQAIALRLMSINLSSVVMPMLFGTAGIVVGVSVVFWTVGALVGMGSAAAWRMRP
jgi:MFS family permease